MENVNRKGGSIFPSSEAWVLQQKAHQSDVVYLSISLSSFQMTSGLVAAREQQDALHDVHRKSHRK